MFFTRVNSDFLTEDLVYHYYKNGNFYEYNSEENPISGCVCSFWVL
ncbi:hypothetical protein LSO10F_180009 [Candidatus Liberibacter solanacearum]